METPSNFACRFCSARFRVRHGFQFRLSELKDERKKGNFSKTSNPVKKALEWREAFAAVHHVDAARR